MKRLKFRLKRLIESHKITPNPAVKRFFRGKVKISLFFNLFVWGAALLVSFYPHSTDAGYFSSLRRIVDSTASETSAAESRFNSQTIPLLQPAINLDPNPSKGGGDITVVGEALLPELGPSGSLADIEERPENMQVSVYVVRRGDTLAQIAKMFDVSVNTIVWANDIRGGLIREGQALVILPITGIRHTVAKGDTLQSIAKKYKADLGEISQYNDIASGVKLEIGTIVIIPDGEIAPAPVAPSRTSPLRGVSSRDLAGAFIWPVEGGRRTQGLHGYNGIDIGASVGTPVYAAADGAVIVARGSGWNGGYGIYVVITHDSGVQTLYSHLSRLAISAGASVSRGQIIGYIGATGRATGPHLHFEVRGAKNPF